MTEINILRKLIRDDRIDRNEFERLLMEISDSSTADILIKDLLNMSRSAREESEWQKSLALTELALIACDHYLFVTRDDSPYSQQRIERLMAGAYCEKVLSLAQQENITLLEQGISDLHYFIISRIPSLKEVEKEANELYEEKKTHGAKSVMVAMLPQIYGLRNTSYLLTQYSQAIDGVPDHILDKLSSNAKASLIPSTRIEQLRNVILSL